MFKLITNLFKGKRRELKYVDCLHHRTWLQRQVEEELFKLEVKNSIRNWGKDKEEEWYSKYL
tara:strand:+ start:981 stop:1166 length:186 start_codon:yes stop_codon:yes gene_type:complete